ncbi:MAG: hypothetical protein ACE366_08255 [Bradymonadia bacterium]
MWMRNALFSMLAFAFIVPSMGCGDDKKPPVRPVEGQSFLIDAEAFDLETVVGLVKENKVANAKALEETINADNGINNVDLDNDNQIDYVLVHEERENKDTVLNFKAVPSSKGNVADAVSVATLRVGPNTAGDGQVHVRGGYPNYVRGYNNYYYSYHSPMATVGTAAFMVWALNHSRPVYYAPMVPSYYSYRPIYSRSVRTTKRTTYRTQTRVSPVSKASRPSSFKPATSTKTAQRVKQNRVNRPSTSTTSGKGLSSRSGKATSFSKQTAPKSTATGFGSGSRSTTSGSRSTTSGSRSTTSGFGSGSRSTTSGSRSSFGRSSSSGSRSSFGRSSSSSSSRRSSFGGSRRRR